MPDDEIENRKLCAGCVGEAYLRNEIILTGGDGVCFYCGSSGKTIRIEEFAEFIEAAFEDHYEPTPTEPSAVDFATGDVSGWDRDGELFSEIVVEDAEITNEIAGDIKQVLGDRHFDSHRERVGEESPFGADVRYIGKEVNDTELQINYFIFERRLKTEARFFDRRAMGMLDSIFENLTQVKAADDRPVIVNAGPGTGLTALFRAREFQADDELKKALISPAAEIGPPPPDKAKAGRMNAHGIATFYGARDDATARAEARPAVGSRVVVARFEIIRPLRLFDVEALRTVLVEGSLFDRRLRRRQERAKFLKDFSERITRPIMPNAKDLEYVPTQVIAEYLAGVIGLDGVIYPSAQGDGAGANVALFHRAASVEPLPDAQPRPAQIETVLSVNLVAHADECQVPNYWVYESASAKSPRPQTADLFWVPDIIELASDPPAAPALRLDLSSVHVHHIEGVQYAVKDYPVTYHCYGRK